MKVIRRVAVLGAGTMGSRIAAQLANAKIPSVLLDVTVDAAKKGLDAALKGRPAAFFQPADTRGITPGSFDADLGLTSDCDWIIEAVTEDLGIKRALYDRLVQHRRPGAIVSTNTSGIPLHRISHGHSQEFRRHFCGTHFFNPPRYLHLMELIPGPETLPEILEFLTTFCDLKLGKGVVLCKDTPNFIANRIGSFFGATVQKLTLDMDLSIEEVDVLTGPLIGLPKSASYRLLDIVGIDVWAHVTKNLAEAVPTDPYHERFVMVPFLMALIQRGWLGDKSGQGCYKRVGKDREIHAIDWKTLEYHPAARPRFASLDSLFKLEPLSDRLKAVVALSDRAGKFVWELLSDHLLYAAWMVPEISDNILAIDRAMRWGYANALGPFEIWDALGFEQTARRMETEGKHLPDSVLAMLSSGASGFYRHADRDRTPHREFFDLTSASGYIEEPERPGITALAHLKRARGVVRKNAGASLLDLGDGVLCCEFHSKMNAMGDDAGAMLRAGLQELERGFDAMVIGNQGEHFSAGANLMMVLLASQEGEWDELDSAVRRFQQTNMMLKYAPKPVVAAPFAMALGGGCEVPLHCARIQASAELYMGLVEVGVGVIPAGGGCKEMLARGFSPKQIFEQIGFAKISGSAAEARSLGYLRDADGISMNPERLIDDAKRLALSLVPAYTPGAPRNDIPVGGEETYALLKLGAWMAHEGAYISDYDAIIGEKLAFILSGGRKRGAGLASEQDLLDLEREAFLSLCGNRKTQERIQHMLKTGKPLRN